MVLDYDIRGYSKPHFQITIYSCPLLDNDLDCYSYQSFAYGS